MQLAKIKIAGFKSFVDPTTVALPGKLVAIVGPNGCGKSNIIDAVTWVMGESSPKYLRGEALTDVIFNGSNARKPVGQASVELIFDNHDGQIGGEYAAFTDISVKRIITRDSDSSYYLNGVRCRKRDIVGIFLGTGIGPRSYSIIGQNMISRIIEAKPEELRTYLEEAAGISKYKERRHETEIRIQHTKENLVRIQDLHTALEKQLSSLKHQANVAEKFKNLKQQERILKAELYAIQWRHLDSKMVEHTLGIKREETGLEARHSELSTTDREIEQMRHEQRVGNDAFQEVQRRYYAVGNEITRIEQDILHYQERRHQWANALKQTEGEWQSVKDEMDQTDDDIRDITHTVQVLEPELAMMTKESVLVSQELAQAEEEMQIWQNRWDEFNQSTAKTTQTGQVEKTHIQHFEQRMSVLQKRHEQLQQEQNRINFSGFDKEIEEHTSKAYAAAEKLAFQTEELTNSRKELSTLHAAQQDSTNHLDKVRSELQRLRGQQASLEALQETALGRRDNPIAPWSKQHSLENMPRLAQEIQVAEGWEFAVEKILGFCLQAICVDKMNPMLPLLPDFKSGNLCIITSKQGTRPRNSKGTLLLEKVKSPWPLETLIDGIYIADDLESALKLCEQLNANESVITRDGQWVNQSWIKILREEDPAAGIFQREHQLKEINKRIDKTQGTQNELEKNIKERREQIQKLEQNLDQLQQTFNQQQNQSAHLNAQLKMKKERFAELKIQSERFMKEQGECISELKILDTNLIKSRTLWQQTVKQLEQQTQAREEFIVERDKARQQLQTIRGNTNLKKEKMHELELRLQTAMGQKSSLHQNILRLQNQLSALNERKITLQSELTSMPPFDTLEKSLSRALDKHVSIEVQLNTARVAVESLDHEFKRLEEKRSLIERDINKIRNALEGLRVEWQGWKVKSDTLIEQMKETEFKLEDILKDLPQEATTEEARVKLEQMIQRINRLGPINLVAIEEYAACLERKQYLDTQLEDLHSGMTTLADAIAKIDRETKSRFKETFDSVNARFQELFPTVFEGGKAYLDLNSDDLLTAGITMMACPPGKRNSSIYLLSGGEKSLTAIALIFSIFHLNPAPFCLLDEVDAALDDANVLRFTRLVKAMADKTQFIFISHNKITIEVAEHLIGITMNEPGVSRLVSVDIEKAMTLAGA